MTNLKQTLGGALVAAAALPFAAHAETIRYSADLEELNSSGVFGRIVFDVDSDARTLDIMGDVSGLVPNELHIQHIHGRFEDDGTTPRNSVSPTAADDADGDGIVEVAEGAPAYGDILLPIGDQSDGFNNGPIANAAGEITVDLSFDLDDDSQFLNPLSGTQYTGDDLLPLDLREYVIHGLFVGPGVNPDLPEGGYDISVPVATAQIAPVPLPAGIVLLGGGLAAFGAMRRRKTA